MIRLYNTQTNALLGEITETQLKFLQDQLEEESADDRDYYLTADTLLMFEQAGADPALVTLLRGGLDANGELEIRWSDT